MKLSKKLKQSLGEIKSAWQMPMVRSKSASKLHFKYTHIENAPSEIKFTYLLVENTQHFDLPVRGKLGRISQMEEDVTPFPGIVFNCWRKLSSPNL